MRVGLLTIAGPDLPDGLVSPLRLQIGEGNLAARQLGEVLRLGCERVVLLAPAYDPAMAQLQHRAEAAGASLHIVGGARGLAGLVAADDEVIALAPGLFAPAAALAAALGDGGVVVQRAATAAPGFERLDAEDAAAGAMRFPGWVVERLDQLDGEIDVFAALQRLALQAGVPRRLLPQGADAGRWRLVRNEAEAQAAETDWLRGCVRAGPPTPAWIVGRAAVRVAGLPLLHAGSGPRVVAIASAGTVALGLVAGWFGQLGSGLLLFMLGFTLAVIAGLLGGLTDTPGALSARRWRAWLDWGFDGALALLLSWAIPGEDWFARSFVALMALGLVRLLPTLESATPRVWVAWLEDRAVLTGGLAIAAWGGVLPPAVRLLALALLVAMLAGRRARPADAGFG